MEVGQLVSIAIQGKYKFWLKVYYFNFLLNIIIIFYLNNIISLISFKLGFPDGFPYILYNKSGPSHKLYHQDGSGAGSGGS